MKEIYNLGIGDSFYVKEYNIYGQPVAMYYELDGDSVDDKKNYLENARNCGIAFLTEEECQRSIDYDVALAKINKRASELYDDEIEQDYCYIDFDADTNSLWYFATHQLDDEEMIRGYARRRTGYRLCFDKDICGRLIEEFPEECKTVLGVS